MQFKTYLSLSAILLASFTFAAKPTSNQFAQNQALGEVSRLAAQFDVMNQNLDDVSVRVQRLEAKGTDPSVRREIDSIKASIEELRRDMQRQRGEIIDEVAKLLDKHSSRLAASSSSSKSSGKQTPQPQGPCMEYEVQKGDNLYIIAKAFDTTVAKIKEMNGLKSDNLSVGQKLFVPKN